jgi:hypothetical protein
MTIGRIFQSIIALFLLVGLFFAAWVVIIITVVVLVALGLVHWLRGKGVIASPDGTFKHAETKETIKPEHPEVTVIEGEYQTIDEEEVKH